MTANVPGRAAPILKGHRTAVAAGSVLALLPTGAHAYLDPGTGSILLQGLVAAVAGGMIFFRHWWHRLTGLFSRPDRNARPDDRTGK